jgi:hypothetical protein
MLNAADASVNDFNLVGICTVLVGAVLGRWSASGKATRSAELGLTGGIGSVSS